MLKNLKNLRKELGLSQKQIANILHISQQTYSDYENRKTEPTSETLIAIANYFEVTVDELLGRDEFTPEERAAGFSETRKMDVTPIEEDAVYIVRQIGKRYGEQAQRDYLTVGENMLKLK